MTLVRLKEPLDFYHQRRAEVHGYIYWLMDPERPIEYKSLATGKLISLLPECLESVEDGPQLPQ